MLSDFVIFMLIIFVFVVKKIVDIKVFKSWFQTKTNSYV